MKVVCSFEDAYSQSYGSRLLIARDHVGVRSASESVSSTAVELHVSASRALLPSCRFFLNECLFIMVSLCGTCVHMVCFKLF